jgi:protein O-GlcNAc transferase
MKARRLDEAVEAYQASLRYRPNYAGTYLNLGYALRDSGRVAEAVTAWEQALRLAPNDRTAREELGRLAKREN